jgi:DNA-binding NtrC family response regulator
VGPVTRPTRVLVVDDEPAMREVLSARLERWGYDVRTADCAAAARAEVDVFHPDVVVCDLVLPDATGLDLLDALRASDQRRTVLLITSYGTIDVAVKAIKGGATNFLTKPLDYGALRVHLEAAAQLDELATSQAVVIGTPVATSMPVLPRPVAGLGGMVGVHPALVHMQDRIRAAALSTAPVLIVGESGTGKELVARTIVALSARSKKPFVVVNAAAIPESLVEAELFGSEKGAFTGADRARVGLFEEAHTGTLFLDEITEMPMALQPKLLRTLEDGRIRRLGARIEIPCDVRVIAATNRNPTVAVERGLLRHDLIYRLDVLRVDVPPLRDRRSDIPLLTSWFISDCARRYDVPVPDIDAEALAVLDQHGWPGNIRELRNVIERAFVLAAPQAITAVHLGLARTEPGLGSGPGEDNSGDDGDDLDDTGPHGIVIPHGLTLADAERIVIVETLKRTGNNKAEAARRLGLDVKTIRNKLKAFGIDGSSP